MSVASARAAQRGLYYERKSVRRLNAGVGKGVGCNRIGGIKCVLADNSVDKLPVDRDKISLARIY